MTIPITCYPISLPKSDTFFLSIIHPTQSTFLHWAFHSSAPLYTPSLFWKTPTLITDDLESDPVEALSRHMPQVVHDYTFGKGNAASIKNAKETCHNINKGQELTVYVLGTEQDTLIERLVTCIPCRIYKMPQTDFFGNVDKDKFPSDRLAALCGANQCYGSPSLVLDVAATWSYVACDTQGDFIGGGISPGIDIRVKELQTLTGEEFHDAIQRANNNALSLFAKNTHDATVVSLLNELLSSMRHVIAEYRNHVGNEKVVVTGVTSEILARLLQNKLLESNTSGMSVEVICTDHLAHFGIAEVLGRNRCDRKEKLEVKKNNQNEMTPAKVDKKRKRTKPKTKIAVRRQLQQNSNEPAESLDQSWSNKNKNKNSGDKIFKSTVQCSSPTGSQFSTDPIKDPRYYLGKRIGKEFGEEIFFGNIVSYDDELWHVKYDDGDEEDYDINDLKKYQKTYKKHRNNDPAIKESP